MPSFVQAESPPEALLLQASPGATLVKDLKDDSC